MLNELIETDLTLFLDLFCFSDKRLIAKIHRELYNDFDPNTKCALETEQNPPDTLFHTPFYEMHKASFYEIHLQHI